MCRGCRKVVKTGWQVVRQWTHYLPHWITMHGQAHIRLVAQLFLKWEVFQTKDTEGCKYSLGLCNACCFSSATVVAQTPLIVMVYMRFLSCQVHNCMIHTPILVSVVFLRYYDVSDILDLSGVPRNFVWGGGSTNSVENRGQRERGSEGGSQGFWRQL
jgi:hypothetical protein